MIALLLILGCLCLIAGCILVVLIVGLGEWEDDAQDSLDTYDERVSEMRQAWEQYKGNLAADISGDPDLWRAMRRLGAAIGRLRA